MLAAALVTVSTLVAAAPALAHRSDLEFRGEAIVPTGTMFEGTTVGGLSSIAYDEKRRVYYTISDDQAQPVRFYTVGLDVRDGRLSAGDVRFEDVTTIPFAPSSVDPEGLALTKDRELIITSEGITNSGIDPFVRRYSLGGRFLGDLPVPQDFLVTPDESSGVRQNLGFESAGVHGRDLFVGAENALFQDGPPATVSNGSRARILRYDLKRERVERQWFYVTDPVAEQPVPPAAFSVNGLVELLPLDDDTPARDGALVLGRRARDGEHDQALRRVAAAPHGAQEAAAEPRRTRHPARQRRRHGLRAAAAARQAVARAGQR